MKSKIVFTEFIPLDLELIKLRAEQSYLLNSLKRLNMTATQYGEHLITQAATSKDGKAVAWTALVDGEVVGCGGIFHVWADVYEAWTVFSEEIHSYGKSIFKEVRRQIKITDFGRLQAITEPEFTEARNFLEHLGFEQEAILEKFDSNNSDVVMYKIIRN